MRILSLALCGTVLALSGCQADAPTAPDDLGDVEAARKSAWSTNVTGHGLLDAGSYEDISVSVSAREFAGHGKGNVQYSRSDADLHVDVQCVNVSADGSQVALAGPLKVQRNESAATYVDGSWWRYYIETAPDGTQWVRFNSAAEGTCAFTSPVAMIHTGKYKVRQ